MTPAPHGGILGVRDTLPSIRKKEKMSDTDFVSPLREVIDNQITFNTPRLAPYFLAAMDLLFNDLEIGNYKPSDRCNAGLEQLSATLDDLSEEASEEIITQEETKEDAEEEASIEREEEEIKIELKDEDESEDEEGFLA